MTLRLSNPLTLTFLAVAWLATAAVASAQLPLVPFPCDGEAYVTQDYDGVLYRVDQTSTPVVFTPICTLGFEVNGLGFRRSDGFLYAVQVDLDPQPGSCYNDGFIRIGKPPIENVNIDCPYEPLGPANLPTDIGINCGDVSPQSTKMWIAWHAQPDWYYELDLIDPIFPGGLPPVIPRHATCLTPPCGVVLDWALNPKNGKLYGCDRDGPDIAELDPVTGIRIDYPCPGMLSGIPKQYGATWFNSVGRLFVYENHGTLYEIDLGDPSSPTPSLIRAQAGPSTMRNDGAACICQCP